jgi:hypothetical protein
MLMRNIGTSLFRYEGRRAGLAVRSTGGDGHATGQRFCRSPLEKGLPAQVGTNYLKTV